MPLIINNMQSMLYYNICALVAETLDTTQTTNRDTHRQVAC